MEQKAARIIAIDGPVGAGKSTVAKEVARQLQFTLIDTGALYRCVALGIATIGAEDKPDETLATWLSTLHVQFVGNGAEQRVWMQQEDVTQKIRTEAISRLASKLGTRQVVRQALLPIQRQLAAAGDTILEGRDIGTVVCPQAPLKFFLVASPEERAKRRMLELQERGEEASFEQVFADLQQRDTQDQNRLIAPLKPAPDAMLIDSTSLSTEMVVEKIVITARHRLHLPNK